MLLAPSDIHFISDSISNGLNLTPQDEHLISSVSNEICGNSSKSLPKIQVSEKGGSYFALNNSSLHVYRELERRGKCSRIKVDLVDLNKVPEHVQRGMIVKRDSLKHFSSVAYQTQNRISGAEGQSNRVECDEESNKSFQKVPVDCTISGELEQQHITDNSSEELLVMQRCPNFTSSDACRGSIGDDSDATTSTFSATDYSDQDDLSESECDEDLTCNVCDRSFESTRQLSLHQQKKRHFGCSVCDSIFPSLMRLEHHKESLDHWSEDEGNTHDSDDSDEESDDLDGPDGKVEELERLL